MILREVVEQTEMFSIRDDGDDQDCCIQSNLP